MSAVVRKNSKTVFGSTIVNFRKKRQNELLAQDYMLNAQEISVWLDRMEK
ncbi:uncharacterized protein METZ01_LOCUS184816 [marine metagenome]|uniref:Uncharacterized protein n=1 Tax=marine metagenome TaxID=408172 RepID=A0A382D1M3_9ZZZZ